MGINDFIEYVEQRWQMMTAHPGTFFGGFLIALVVGGSIGMLWRGQEVANAHGLVAIKDERIDMLEREREANAAIVQRAREWDVRLTEQQVGRLESSLSTTPASVEIISGAEGAAGASQFEEAFQRSGWQVNTSISANADNPQVVLRTDSPSGMTALQSALAEAGVKYHVDGMASGDGSTDFFLTPDLTAP